MAGITEKVKADYGQELHILMNVPVMMPLHTIDIYQH